MQQNLMGIGSFVSHVGKEILQTLCMPSASVGSWVFNFNFVITIIITTTITVCMYLICEENVFVLLHICKEQKTTLES